MPSAVVVLLLLSSGVADLTSEAAGSGRPRACAAAGASSAPSHGATRAVWQKARERRLAILCARLSSTQILLGTAPAEALTAAEKLAAEWPERSEPRELVARALTRLGRHADAWPLWAASSGSGEPSSAGTGALHDYALAAVMTGHDARALAAYRTLVTRSASSSDRSYRARILIEATAAALRVEGARTEEALGYLAAATAERSTPLLATAAAALARLANVLGPGALVDSPSVEPASAWALLREVEAPAPARAGWPSLPRHELEGLAALVIAPHDAGQALALWQKYLAGLEARGEVAPTALQRARAELSRLRGGTTP